MNDMFKQLNDHIKIKEEKRPLTEEERVKYEKQLIFEDLVYNITLPEKYI